MTESRPRRSDAERNREAILDAAADAFAEDVDATLLDIAARAGVSRATIYRHFPDLRSVRVALFTEVESMGRDAIQEELRKSLENSEIDNEAPEVRIARMFGGILRMENRITKVGSTYPLAEEGLIKTFGPVTSAFIKRSQDRSEFRSDIDIDLMAESVIAFGYYASRRVHSGALTVEQAVEMLLILVRGMETSPRPAIAPVDD